MHPRTTIKSTQRSEVGPFGLKFAGALALDNEYSGVAVLLKLIRFVDT